MAINQVSQQDVVRLLYEEHHRWLRAWITKKLGCASVGADLAQDTYLRLLQKDHIPPLVEPKAYLTKIAHDVTVNFLQRRAIEQAYLEAIAHLTPQQIPSLEHQVILLETLYEIDVMLRNLSPNIRKAYLMLQLDGAGYAEIAQDLGVSVRTVTTYIAKATLHCALARAAFQRQGNAL